VHKEAAPGGPWQCGKEAAGLAASPGATRRGIPFAPMPVAEMLFALGIKPT